MAKKVCVRNIIFGVVLKLTGFIAIFLIFDCFFIWPVFNQISNAESEESREEVAKFRGAYFKFDDGSWIMVKHIRGAILIHEILFAKDSNGEWYLSSQDTAFRIHSYYSSLLNLKERRILLSESLSDIDQEKSGTNKEKFILEDIEIYKKLENEIIQQYPVIHRLAEAKNLNEAKKWLKQLKLL